MVNNTKFCIELFVFFMEKLSYSGKYNWKNNPRQVKTIENFCIKIKKHYGESAGKVFLIDYIESQFNYWYYCYKEGKLGQKWHYLNAGWIFGNKAIIRFHKFHKNNTYPKDLRTTRKDLSIFPEKFFLKKQPLLHFIDIKKYEENEKARYFNTAAGLQWCIDETTLINPKSNYCNRCKYRNNCKNILEKNYKQIFNARYEIK